MWYISHAYVTNVSESHQKSAMAKIPMFLCLVFLAILVEGREWKFESAKRVKRGYNNGGYGESSYGTYGKNYDQNGSQSKEGCSDEERKNTDSYSGSRESYNRDERRDERNDNRHGTRSISKATASSSATAFNINQKANL